MRRGGGGLTLEISVRSLSDMRYSSRSERCLDGTLAEMQGMKPNESLLYDLFHERVNCRPTEHPSVDQTYEPDLHLRLYYIYEHPSCSTV